MSAKNRLFYTLPEREHSDVYDITSKGSDILSYIRENVIGRDKVFSGPFGLRKALYLDYTASGRSLEFLEDYIRSEVLPEYGNTHTTSSVSSLQTTLYRHEARDIIRNAVHASEHDAVIFVGSGATGAVHKLIHSLDLKHEPVVFVGPYEHHSNLLPWKEIGAKLLRIPTDGDGRVDIHYLEELLQMWQGSGRQLIGCFSAASNITGTLCDTDAITVCLHRHGALAFWDYATAAPYVNVDMNPVTPDSESQQYMYKDAMFISPHKFVGGVQTPGVLIAKKSLFRNRVPDGCGGGSVFFVRRGGHRYLQEPELKEEGGTPAIVEAVRAGLVFQLKQAVTSPVIADTQRRMYRAAVEAWRDCEGLVLLGNLDSPRLPIFSFLVYHGDSGRFLHHNFVSVLLNDLFGIQARGGCACAGPYAMDLLGMEEDISRRFESLLAEDRPGFTRINLPFHLDNAGLHFTLAALRLVAQSGWKLLPHYMFNPDTGEWRQKHFQVFKDRKWLGHISYASSKMTYRVPPPVVKGPLPDTYQECLEAARQLIADIAKTSHEMADHRAMFDEAANELRWFLLPSEAAACIHGNDAVSRAHLPFCPPLLRQHLGLPVFVAPQSDDQPTGGLSANVCPLCSQHRSLLEDCQSVVADPSGSVHDHTEFSTGFIEHLDKGFEATSMADGVDDHTTTMCPGSTSGVDARPCGDAGRNQDKGASLLSFDLTVDIRAPGPACDTYIDAGTPTADTGGVNPDHPPREQVCSPAAGQLPADTVTGAGVPPADRQLQDRAPDRQLQDQAPDRQLQDRVPDRQHLLYRAPDKQLQDRAPDRQLQDWTPGMPHLDRAPDRQLQDRAPGRQLQDRAPDRQLQDRAPDRQHLERALLDWAPDRQLLDWAPDRQLLDLAPDRQLQDRAPPDSVDVHCVPWTHPGSATNSPAYYVAAPVSANTAAICDNVPTTSRASTGEDRTTDTALPGIGIEVRPAGDGMRKAVLAHEAGKPASNTDTCGGSADTAGIGHRTGSATSPCSPRMDLTANQPQPAANIVDKHGSLSVTRKVKKWFSPPKNIFTPFLKAVEEYGMLRDGDRVLVCLSGGKDSLSLLHTVAQYRFYARHKGVSFEMGVVTVDPQTPSFDPSPLKTYIAALGLPYFYESQCIMEQASSLSYECASICSFCSRMKRGRIYACARREGYNVLALGQHLDDLCEREGDLRVIRPMVYVREKQLRSFAEKNKLPVIAENCPACFVAPKERHRAKQLLATQEIMFPQIFNSMAAAIQPIMAINRTGVKVAHILQKSTSKDDVEI